MFVDHAFDSTVECGIWNMEADSLGIILFSNECTTETQLCTKTLGVIVVWWGRFPPFV